MCLQRGTLYPIILPRVLIVLVILSIMLGLQVHGHKKHQDQEEQEEDDGQVEGHGAPWAGAVEQQLLVRIV